MTDMTSPYSPLGDDLGEPPGWPKVIGIISIVWGGIGLTCIGCGLVVMPMLPSLIGKPDQPLPPNMQLDIPTMCLFAFGFLQTLLLITAGILTLKRTPAGHWLHLGWAVISIVVLPVSLYFSWRKQQLMGPWVLDHPDSPFAKGYKPGAGNIGLVFQGLLGAAWPVFILLWFGLVKRNPARMKG